MEDDFNTPGAMAVLFELAHAINKARGESPDKAAALAALLRKLAGVLGLLARDPETYLRGGATAGAGDAEIDALVEKRLAAKKARNFAEADRIRDELKTKGVILEDAPGGKTVWRRQ
jgi:cysteinyl-tRNA synthetase